MYELYRQRAGAALPEREVIGVDLGQSRDPTAIAVVRRVDVAAGVPPPEPEAVPAAEPAPAVAYAEGSSQWRQTQQEAARPGFALVRHPDPSASIGLGQPGAIPGTWVVPAGAVEDLAAHGFRLIQHIDGDGAPCLAEADSTEPASGQPPAASGVGDHHHGQ
jgi:hypothetical protein